MCFAGTGALALDISAHNIIHVHIGAWLDGGPFIIGNLAVRNNQPLYVSWGRGCPSLLLSLLHTVQHCTWLTTDNTGWISAAHYKVHYFTVTLLVNLSPRGFWLLSHGPSIIRYCRQPASQSVSSGGTTYNWLDQSDRQYKIALLGGIRGESDWNGQTDRHSSGQQHNWNAIALIVNFYIPSL